MKVKNSINLLLVALFLFALFAPILMAGEHNDEETGELNKKISTEGLSGFNLFLVNLYNDHRLIYAIITTVSMAVFGGIIALFVDFILARLGLTVSKMEHRE